MQPLCARPPSWVCCARASLAQESRQPPPPPFPVYHACPFVCVGTALSALPPPSVTSGGRSIARVGISPLPSRCTAAGCWGFPPAGAGIGPATARRRRRAAARGRPRNTCLLLLPLQMRERLLHAGFLAHLAPTLRCPMPVRVWGLRV